MALHPQLSFRVVGQNLFQPYHVEYGGDPGRPVGIMRKRLREFDMEQVRWWLPCEAGAGRILFERRCMSVWLRGYVAELVLRRIARLHKPRSNTR